MTSENRIKVVGHATSLFLLLSYILCIGFGLIFPSYQMHEAERPKHNRTRFTAAY